MSYFTIERGSHYLDHVVLEDTIDGGTGFENYLNMTYDEMKSQENLDDFVLANMEAADAMTPYVMSTDEDDQTIITLIGDDDIFIWSIIMGTVEEDSVNYVLVDWKKDGKNYRYEN